MSLAATGTMESLGRTGPHVGRSASDCGRVSLGTSAVWGIGQMRKSRLIVSTLLLTTTVACTHANIVGDLPGVLLDDDFSGLRTGLIMTAVGAHAEYHYLPHASQRGNWAVSAFKSYGSQRAWRVIEEGDDRTMLQAYENNLKYTHPMLIAGDPLWRNYRITADFAPTSEKGQSGIVFRYRNDRCYLLLRHQRAKSGSDNGPPRDGVPPTL